MTHMYHDSAWRVWRAHPTTKLCVFSDDVPTSFSRPVARYFNGSIFSGVKINAGSGIEQLSQINGDKPSTHPTNWPTAHYGYYYRIIIIIIIVIWSTVRLIFPLVRELIYNKLLRALRGR